MSKSLVLKWKNTLQLLIVSATILCANTSNAQFYNGSQMTFGKNRIQYTTDRYWSYFRFNDFDTYYYKNGQSLAIYASSYADKQMKIISKQLDFVPDSKIRFLVFNDLSDLKETNIGLITDEDYNIGGSTHVIGNKIFIYFDGTHSDFEKQIKRGIAKVYLNEMMYGGSTGAKIKNSILLSFPTWYTDGLISYLSDDWSTELDDKIRTGIKIKKYEKFDRLTREQQRYAGHSLWKYIELKYGPKAVSDIVFMAKINRNIENGFLYVLGIDYEDLLADWKTYYTKRYLNDYTNFENPTDPTLRKNKEKRVYSQARISADGRYLAFTTNEIGKVKVFVRDLENDKQKRIMKYGYKLDEKVDYNYPLLAWSPNGNSLSLIYERRNTNYLQMYDVENNRKVIKSLNQFDKIHDFSYNNRGNQLAMSAIRNGQSDIYIYSIGGNSYQQLTQDGYDDNFPRFANNDRAVIWSSNRIDDTLRMIEQSVHQIAEDTLRGTVNHDLFFYDFKKNKTTAKRITNTPLADEIYAMELGYNKFAWLSDENGVYNRYIGQFDSAISFIDTTTHYRYFTKYAAVSNYQSNILEQDFNVIANKYSEIVRVENKTRLYVRDIPKFNDYNRLELAKTEYKNQLIKQYNQQELRKKELKNETDSLFQNKKSEITNSPRKHFQVVTPITKNKPPNTEVDINNYQFDGPKTEADQAGQAALKARKKRGPADEIKAAYNSRPYDVEYNVSQIVSQIDFNYLNYSYQPFTNPKSPIFIPQGFNAFIKLGIMDLLEDYRLIGGVKLSPNLQNNEYFVTFSDYKNRLDKDYTFHRNVIEESRADQELTHFVHEFYFKVGYPIDNIRGFKTTLAWRNDNAVVRATDSRNLIEEDQMSNNAIFRLEYVFDKTRSGGLNILYGTRYKVFGEYYQPIEDLDKSLVVLGFDIRNYTQIHKSFVWANRFAGSTSLGAQRLIYYLGGVDNWMNAKFNSDIQVDQEQDFAYQTIATNMRGFHQNIRNGNNFLLWNTELRFPPFQYFSKTPIKSAFWNNFMVVGFMDFGTAWTGSNPFSDNNSLFRKSIYQNPIEVTIISQDDPFVGGYGFGLHSELFGYYMRADWAWGIENGIFHDKSVFYFSLSLDF